MAKDKRPPLPKFNTPVGVARYPHLNKPDTRFDDEGMYKCDLILDAEEAPVTELVDYLTGIRDERFKAEKKQAKKDGKKKKFSKAPIFELDLDEAGDETGKIILKTKLNAVGHNKAKDETWTNEPRLFDSNGNPLSPEVQVWSGSKLIIAGTVNSYAMVNKVLVEKPDGTTVEKKITSVGVSLKCKGVQVIELVTGGEATAESFGFGNVAGGYESDAAKVGLGNQDEGDEGDDGDDDDDGDEDDF